MIARMITKNTGVHTGIGLSLVAGLLHCASPAMTQTDASDVAEIRGDATTMDTNSPVDVQISSDSASSDVIASDAAEDVSPVDVPSTDVPSNDVPSNGGTMCAMRGGICVAAFRSMMGGASGFAAMCPAPRILPNGQTSFFGPGMSLQGDELRLGCPISMGPEVGFQVCCLPGR